MDEQTSTSKQWNITQQLKEMNYQAMERYVQKKL